MNVSPRRIFLITTGDLDAAGGLRVGLATGAAVPPAQSAAMRRLEPAALVVFVRRATIDRALLVTGGSSKSLLMQVP